MQLIATAEIDDRIAPEYSQNGLLRETHVRPRGAKVITRKQWLISSVVAAVVVAYGVFAWATWPARVTLQVTGSPNMKIVGACAADGMTFAFGDFKGASGPVRATGRSISYVIWNVGDEGPMTVEVFVNDVSKDSIVAERGNTVVHGKVKHGKVTQLLWMPDGEQKKKD